MVYTCFKTTWYFTMASLFQSTMVSMVYHGILPWFTCFKTPWHLPWYIFIRELPNSMGRGHLVLLTYCYVNISDAVRNNEVTTNGTTMSMT